MGLFDEKERKELLKKGGRAEYDGGYSEKDKDTERAVELTRKLCHPGAKGFFIIVEMNDSEDGEHTEAGGMIRVANTNKMRILETVVKGLGIDDQALQMFLLTKLMGDNDN